MAETQINTTSNGGGDGGRGGLYALLAIVIVLIIVVIVLFMPNRAGDGTRDIDADIRIETPEVPGGNGGGNGGDTDG